MDLLGQGKEPGVPGARVPQRANLKVCELVELNFKLGRDYVVPEKGASGLCGRGPGRWSLGPLSLTNLSTLHLLVRN